MFEAEPTSIASLPKSASPVASAPPPAHDFRLLLEQLPCITYVCELGESGTVYMTPQCRTVLGYEPEDFIADPGLFLRLLHPHDEADVVAAWEHSSGRHEPFSFEYRLQARDGRYVWLRDEARPVTGPDRRRYMQGMMFDITNHKAAEAALEERRQRYASLFSNNPEAAFSIDLEGNFTEVNPACEELCGYSEAELVGRSFVPLMAPECAEAAARVHQHALQGLSESYELTIIHKNGTRVEVWGKSIPIVVDGVVVGIYGVARDVGTHNAAERALREAEARFRTIFEKAPIGVDLIDREGRIVEANSTLAEMLGYSREELRGMTVEDLTHPDDLSLSIERLRTLEKDGGYGIQKRYMRKDGESIWADVTVSAVAAEDGSWGFAIGVIEDVTEQRRAEGALRDAEERFRQAFENAPIGMSIVSPAGRWLRVNQAMSEITGYSSEQLISMSFADVTHPDDLPANLDLVKDLLTGDRRTLELTKRYLHAEGHEVWVQLNATLVRDTEGRPLYFLSQVQDITHRKRAEEAVREAEARFRRLVEQIPAMTYIDSVGPEGKSEYVSPQVWTIAGVSPDEIIFDPDSWKSLIHHEDRDRVLAAIEEHDATGEPFRCEYRIVRPDGQVRWLFDEAIMVVDDEGRPAFSQGVVFDITQRKELEEQLVRSQKMEAIGRLAGGVAHDFNNLLAVIQNYAGFLIEDFDDGDPRKDDLLEIKAAGERGANLVRQLLTFSRREMVRPELIDVGEVVANMDKLLRRTIGEDIELVVETDPELARLRMDVGHIEQILANLAVNARDAMPGGGRLTIRTNNFAVDGGWLVQQLGVTPERYVCLSVSDTGKGMPEEVASKVFEPFFTTKPKERGTGLGLAIVHGIVEQAGGHISVESAEDLGTTFRIYLPAAVDEEEATGEQACAERSSVRGQGRTILVVEDEDGVRRIVTRILSQAGFEVVESVPERAATLVSERNVDLLLTDVVMPAKSGREVADAGRAVAPELPVLFMSGYTDEVIARHGVLDLDLAFIQKPFQAQELLDAVDALLS